jgi:lysozyme family protein
MEHVFRWEKGLADNPNDPGGRTNFGISFRWLEEHGIDIDGDGAVTPKDIDALTPERASSLYARFFWSPALDKLRDDVVAIYVFDMGVNMGQDRAVRIAQEAAGVEQDGRLGPRTIAALNAVEAHALLERLREIRSQFYRRLAARKPALAVFLRGWLSRAAA